MKKKKKLFLIKLFSLFALVLGCLGFFIFSSKVYAYTIPTDSQPIVTNNNVFSFQNGPITENSPSLTINEATDGYIDLDIYNNSIITEGEYITIQFPIVRASDYNLDFYANKDIIFVYDIFFYSDGFGDFDFGNNDDGFQTWYNISYDEHNWSSNRQGYDYQGNPDDDTLYFNYFSGMRKLSNDSFAINQIKFYVDELDNNIYSSYGLNVWFNGVIGYAEDIFLYYNTNKTLYLDEVMTQQVYNEVQSQFAIRLNDANNTIASQQETIDELQSRITDLERSLRFSNQALETLQQDYDDLQENNMSWEKIFFTMADTPLRVVGSVLGQGQGNYFFGINLFDAFIGIIVALGFIWLIKRFI